MIHVLSAGTHCGYVARRDKFIVHVASVPERQVCPSSGPDGTAGCASKGAKDRRTGELQVSQVAQFSG